MKELESKLIDQLKRKQKNIFGADEMPFLKPSAEYTDLGENISVANKFRANWPAVTFDKACLVDGAILIQDISPDNTLTKAAKKLNEISSITLQIVDGLNLTKDIIALIKKSGVLSNDPLIIYPGNGSQSVKKYLSSDEKQLTVNSISLPTQRTMIENGKFDLTVNYFSLPQNIDTNTVLIIDDVVASGQTAQTIASEIKVRFPDARCILATWLFMVPTKPENKKSSSGIMGIDQTIASIVLKGNLTSRPPINSLSCFTQNDKKYDEIKTYFMQKYINDQNKFTSAINLLKQNITTLKERQL